MAFWAVCDAVTIRTRGKRSYSTITQYIGTSKRHVENKITMAWKIVWSEWRWSDKYCTSVQVALRLEIWTFSALCSVADQKYSAVVGGFWSEEKRVATILLVYLLYNPSEGLNTAGAWSSWHLHHMRCISQKFANPAVGIQASRAWG